MGLTDKGNSDFHQSIQWYVLGGIVVASVAFLVGISACAFRCYKRRQSRSGINTQLSTAIKKGLKDFRYDRGNEEHIFGREGAPRTYPSYSPPGTLDTKSVSAQHDTTAISPTEKKDRMKEASDGQGTLGALHFAVAYDSQKTALVVAILRACGLPAKDSGNGSADPYVKLQLLPEKRHKVKTRVLRKTQSPVYDETFTFYGITPKQLDAVSLHFVILSFDRYSRDDVIGEVVYPLSGLDLHGDKQMALSKSIAPRHIKLHSQGRGELLVSLCHQPAANRLTVVILKARNLPKMDVTGLSDPYVKIYMQYNGQRVAKKKTHVKKRTLNPVFNESFLFDVPCNEGLANISLEMLVLDWDRMTKNEVIGRLELGGKTTGLENHHWNEVTNCPRKQIAEWHKLKE